MYKEERIPKYGEVAWNKKLEQTRVWRRVHPEQAAALSAASSREQYKKGGKYHKHHKLYQNTGLQREKNKIRHKHAKKYYLYKHIIAPWSQIHHEWISETANYRGVALVETDQHMRGFVNVIRILKGKITLLTEKEVREQKEEV